jgi:hypothetical protein
MPEDIAQSTKGFLSPSYSMITFVDLFLACSAEETHLQFSLQ